MSHNNHSLMLSVHNQLDNVISWHFWELLGDDIFEINQMSHVLKCSNISEMKLRKILTYHFSLLKTLIDLALPHS